MRRADFFPLRSLAVRGALSGDLPGGPRGLPHLDIQQFADLLEPLSCRNGWEQTPLLPALVSPCATCNEFCFLNNRGVVRHFQHFHRILLVWALCAITSQAQDASNVGDLKRRLNGLQESLERVQRLHQEQIDALRKQIEAMQSKDPVALTHTPTTDRAAPSADKALKGVGEKSAKAWAPSDSIRIAGRSGSFLDLSVVGILAVGGSTANDLDALQLGGHDPKQRGFTLQNLETAFTGAVDPYFRGQAAVVFQIDSTGESGVEVEEAFLETISLPSNLQLRAGQFFTEFGRQNPTHPHTWAFVDQPLVLGRFLGGDGLRNPGARVSWLVPTPFYSELFLAVQNSQGETAHSFRDSNGGNLLYGRGVGQGSVKAFNDLLFAPRYAVSFELSDNQTVLAGASGAFGPNGSGSDTDTQVYGVDWMWKWKSSRHQGGFPFVTWQSEVLWRRYEAGTGAFDRDLDGAPDLFLPRETLADYGSYSQLSYGFGRGWILGLRGDYVVGRGASFSPDPDRDERWRISPNITWFPSEFSKIRLQYNHDHRTGVGVDHSLWLQLEFLLGAHAAHKF